MYDEFSGVELLGGAEKAFVNLMLPDALHETCAHLPPLEFFTSAYFLFSLPPERD